VTFYRTCPLFPVIKTASVGDKQYFMSEKGLYWVRDGMVVPTEAMNPHVGGLFFDLLADGPTLYMVAGSTFVVYDTQKDKMETLSTPASHTMHLLKIGDHIIGYGASLYPYEGGGGGYSGGAFSFSITGKSIKQLSNLPIVAFNPKNQAARAEETGENDDSPLTITYFKYDPEKDDLKVKLQKGPITDESTLHDHYERMQAMWNERWRDLPGMDPKTFSGMKVYYLTQSLEMGIARTRTF
jgi:hypothetical protein